RLSHRGEYRSSVTPAIAGRDVQLSTSTLLEAEEASQELVRFDAGQTGTIGPLAALLLRSESAASSQIENLTSSARTVALADFGEAGPPNAQLIVKNARAMQAAISLAGQLDEAAILEMHAALLAESNPDATGAWRRQTVWIGGTGIGPHLADFVPPRAELVPAAMADLIEFMARDDLPVLVQAAIAHAQFETIHPFIDGNGRTGRALLHSLLKSKGLLHNVTVPISAGLLADTARYFRSLTAYQQGNPEDIVLLTSEAAFSGIAEARWLVNATRELLGHWRENLTVRRDALSRTVLEELPRQPVLSVSAVEHHFQASNTAARRALEQLEAAGIIQEFTGRKRSKLWVATRLTDLLDEFAARAVRRTR
ncbi:MAG TPA: Fic family protein, partial [Deinococcales bacterium]|nr:Fic family protein [Deinococcales bacterium]